MSERKEYRYECKKCGAVLRLQGTKEQVEAWLDQKFFDCPGRHVEITSPRNYLTFVEAVEITEKPKTAKEILQGLMERYGDHNPENWLHLGSIEKAKELGIESLNSVKGLEHTGFGDFAGGGYEYRRVADTQEGRIYHRVTAR